MNPASPLKRRLVDLLKEKYATTRFDLVLALRPEAVQFAVRHRDVLFRGVPLMFAEVAEDRLPRPDRALRL